MLPVASKNAGSILTESAILGQMESKNLGRSIYDLDKACVVWIGRGKGVETINHFFNEMLSDYQKSRSNMPAAT